MPSHSQDIATYLIHQPSIFTSQYWIQPWVPGCGTLASNQRTHKPKKMARGRSELLLTTWSMIWVPRGRQGPILARFVDGSFGSSFSCRVPVSVLQTFCRWLGGHMNVHRRDRARLHQSQPSTSTVVSSFPDSSPSMLHPVGLGLWFQLYQQLLNPNNVCFVDSISAHFSLWPYNLPPSSVKMNYPQSLNLVDLSAQPPSNLPIQGHGDLFRHSDQLETSSPSETRKNNIKKSKCSSETAMEEEEE